MTAVTKRMFALWGAPEHDLHDVGLRDALAAHGVSRLQVNLDDEAVAGAMRIPAGEAPIGAVLSTWDGAPEEIVHTLTALASVSQVVGWEVEERRPIEPAESWDGVRAEALANIALLRRPEELTHEEWLHRWLVDHTPVAIDTQGTFGYVQNVVVACLTPDVAGATGATAVAALVEELFPMAAVSDLHAFYGSSGSDAELRRRMEVMLASVGRFGADRGLDLVPTSRFLHLLDA